MFVTTYYFFAYFIFLGVSTNRIGEWQRVWYAANNDFHHNDQIQQILKVKDNSLVKLLEAMKAAGWQQSTGPATGIRETRGSGSRILTNTRVITSAPLKKRTREFKLKTEGEATSPSSSFLSQWTSAAFDNASISVPSSSKRQTEPMEQQIFTNLDDLSPFEFNF